MTSSTASKVWLSLCGLGALGVILGGLTTGCDRRRDEARQILQQWLQANVDRDYKRVVALTTDATFNLVAKAQRVSLAEVRKDMPKLLALAPEKLERYSLSDSGTKRSDTEYLFTVVQHTIKQGKRATKREQVHVVLENSVWRVDPTRTTKRE